ncbi:hypothetical protein DVR12_00950 [Chitinophaga silvatica]|uniref:HTH luxR-type domain-containing protein n=1 Tax=Chitinophaga silvatica TaxID=2282649 RepID=A0A3E1YG84_9BACT|nr:hypothetical protein DVR12_00950 [Chitinophaga silvatica]
MNLISNREREVLFHLIEGRLSKEISGLPGISKNTVDNHRKNMLLKMEVTNTSELVYKAIKDGLICIRLSYLHNFNC